MIGKFFIVGAISTVVDFLIYSFLIFLGVPYSVAIVIGYLFGLWVNFKLARERVFSKSRFEKVHIEFIAVFIVSIIAILLNILIVWSLQHVGLDYYIGRLIAIVLVFFFNYFSRKVFIYVA